METASFDKALADQIVTRLLGAGISVAEASDRIGVPYTTLWRRLRTGGFTVQEVHALAGILGTDVGELIAPITAKSL